MKIRSTIIISRGNGANERTQWTKRTARKIDSIDFQLIILIMSFSGIAVVAVIDSHASIIFQSNIIFHLLIFGKFFTHFPLVIVF